MNDYSIIYNDGRYVAIHHNNTDCYSFGYHAELNSFYGFPVNQSFVTADEAKSLLNCWKEIDRAFPLLVDSWQSLIDAIKSHNESMKKGA